MPPDQLNNSTPPPWAVMPEMIAGADVTGINNVALLERPPESVTLTRKLLLPTFTEMGMPESVPLLPTVSQAGPLTKANVSASPGLGSVALVAMVPEMFWP